MMACAAFLDRLTTSCSRSSARRYVRLGGKLSVTDNVRTLSGLSLSKLDEPEEPEELLERMAVREQRRAGARWRRAAESGELRRRANESGERRRRSGTRAEWWHG